MFDLQIQALIICSHHTISGQIMHDYDFRTLDISPSLLIKHLFHLFQRQCNVIGMFHSTIKLHHPRCPSASRINYVCLSAANSTTPFCNQHGLFGHIHRREKKLSTLPTLCLYALSCCQPREDRVFGQNYPSLSSLPLSSLIYLWLRIKAVHAELEGI